MADKNITIKSEREGLAVRRMLPQKEAKVYCRMEKTSQIHDIHL